MSNRGKEIECSKQKELHMKMPGDKGELESIKDPPAEIVETRKKVI